MNTIPHSYELDASQVPFLPHAPPSTQGVTGDYLLERWLPVLGPDKYALVCVLRNQCSLDPTTNEFLTEFSLDLDDLAAKAGMSRAKVCRLLKRNSTGTILAQRPDGTTTASDLNRFIKIAQQHRYSETHGRRVQAVNRFTVIWPIPSVPGDEAYHALLSESHNEMLTTTRIAQSPSQTAPVPSCVGARPTTAKTSLENLKMRQQGSSSPLVPEGIPSNGLLHRTIGERRQLDKGTPGKDEKKTLVGGEASTGTKQQHATRERPESPRSAPASTKQPEKKAPTLFDLALALAENKAGGIISDLLKQYGDPNPAVGMKTILVALVHAGAPVEKLPGLAYLGRNRLRRWRMRGGQIRTTEPGYFINLMRNLANEAKDKAWDTQLMEVENQVKHEEALRRMGTCGEAPRSETAPAPPEADQAAPDEESAALEETAEVADASDEAPSLAGGGTDADPPTFPPEEAAPVLEAEEGATDETWVDRLLPTIPGLSGHQGDVGTLWGYVREALRAKPDMSLSRKQHLEAVTPAVDPDCPRELVLLSTSGYTARFIERTLLREIEAQRGKLLYQHFDAVRIQSVRHLPAWAEREEEQW